MSGYIDEPYIDEYKTDAEIGLERYNKVRKLTPAEFKRIYDFNKKTGRRFDVMVDDLAE